MKCKTCGHRTSSLPAMLRHYKSKHPQKLKHKKSVAKKVKGKKYCSECGQLI